MFLGRSPSPKGTALRDPFFSSVVLLLHAGGANLSTTFTDSSPKNKTPTTTTNMAIETAQGLYGQSIVPQTETAYLGYGSDTDLALGTGDFTFEFNWVRSAHDVNPINTDLITTSNLQTGSGSLNFQAATGSNFSKFYVGDATVLNLTSSGNFTGSWALTRASGTFRMYFNGALQASATPSTLTLTAADFRIGYCSYGGGGNISQQCAYSEVRVTKGTARYTGSSYTLQTAPFPNH